MVSSHSCLVFQKGRCGVSFVNTTKGIIRAFGAFLLFELSLHVFFFGLGSRSDKEWGMEFNRRAMSSMASVGIELGGVYATAGVATSVVGGGIVMTGTGCCGACSPA